MKLSKGQAFVLALAASPMAAVGIAGAVATYVNMNNVLHRGESALGLVAAGEGAVLIASLVALAVTLMGQHTPAVVRAAMWLVPVAASLVGVALAPSNSEAVVMGFTPMAMTAAGEGVAFVARRVVAYRTGVDIEQQRRSGLLLWHANRAANGKGIGRKLSERAVWRLTKSFAATDGQLSVQLGEIQRFRIGQGADENLAAVLTAQGTASRPAASTLAVAPDALRKAVSGAHSPLVADVPVIGNPELRDWRPASLAEHQTAVQPTTAPGWVKDELARIDAQAADPLDEHFEQVAEVLAETEQAVTGGLLTSDDVAELLNVKPGTVRTWVHRNKLRPVAHVEGRSMFRREDAEKLRG